MARFALDADQTDAILELKIYRLARLEILVITNELADKRKRARQIGALLADDDSRWAIVREELETIQKTYGNAKADPRRTLIEAAVTDVEYSADDFIVEEDNVVILTRDGWVKRQKEVKDLATTRLREGDQVIAVLAGSTRATAVFFTNFGIAYSCRIVDVPASTGYGEPIQRLFKFRDGERVVGAVSLDPRVTPNITPAAEGQPAPVHAVAVTTDGYALRFNLDALRRPEHARRAPVRASGRGRRGGGRGGDRRHRDDDRGHAAGTRGALPRRGDQLPRRARAAVSSSSSSRPTTTACSGSSPRAAIGT